MAIRRIRWKEMKCGTAQEAAAIVDWKALTLTRRIIWFCEPTPGNYGHKNIRLELQTPDGTWFLYPKDEDHAEVIWNLFKDSCPDYCEQYGTDND